MNQKTVIRIGWLSSFMCILVFLSYIDQIRLNLAGHKGSILLPIVTIVNCSCWLMYGLFKEPRDYPLIVCNSIGVIVGTLTTITGIL